MTPLCSLSVSFSNVGPFFLLRIYSFWNVKTSPGLRCADCGLFGLVSSLGFVGSTSEQSNDKDLAFRLLKDGKQLDISTDTLHLNFDESRGIYTISFSLYWASPGEQNKQVAIFRLRFLYLVVTAVTHVITERG